MSSDSLLDLGDLKAVSVLGRGAKGVVFLVHSPTSDESLALKAISRSNVEHKRSANAEAAGGDAYRRIWFERDVLLALRHPLLPSLRGVVSTDKIVGFAIDRCSGGDLNSLRRRQTEKMFSDDVIRFYAAELVLALEYLHGSGIVYRDLKPENILIQENGHIMLVDFDLSTRLPAKILESPTTPPRPPSPPPPLFPVEPGKKQSKNNRFLRSCFSSDSGVSPEEDSAVSSSSSSTTTTTAAAAAFRGGASPDRAASSSSSSSSPKSNSFVGTEDYVAPEIIQGNGHDFAVDWWGLGVVLYEMLYGRTPFRGQNRKETFYRILTKDPELVGEQTPLRALIAGLLEKDPLKRITCEEVKRHEFFRGVDWESVVQITRPPFIPSGVEWEETAAEDEQGSEAIDVEKLVQEVFG
ncbi:serine/threonine-protein kinase OXI1-like [Typha latifolia]|uniref:serine/threonine-protein kinase OXI1-like n=1 Tax=Typha latifolia TaxID=4733 RepID=UPI003C2F757B